MSKRIEKEDFKQIREWMYRNARNVELCMWQYVFEQGTAECVLDALSHYQNDDGGFGHAIEADNWNPNSTPIATHHVLKTCKLLGIQQWKHPIFENIMRYLESMKDFMPCGWCFCVPSNDSYPHAPWWNYSEEENQREYFGITAGLSGFILEYGKTSSDIYEKAISLAIQLLDVMEQDIQYGDMGLAEFIELVEVCEQLKIKGEKRFEQKDILGIKQILRKKVTSAIEHDTEKWKYYGVRPSNFIIAPEGDYYMDNKDIMQAEIDYLLNTRPQDDVWGITWTWFEHMDRYASQFALSETWWKGYKAVEKMILLRNFGVVTA